MTACACIGPVGDCPCIRREKGLPVPINEATVSKDVWDSMTDDEKNTINEIKLRAAMRYVFGKGSES